MPTTTADRHELPGRVERKLTLLKWMCATNLVLTIVILVMVW